MKFQKGHKLATGRPKGSRNKLSTDIRQTVLDTWAELQGNDTEEKKTSLRGLAHENPQWFYDFVKPMLPKEIFVSGELNLQLMSREELLDQLRGIIEAGQSESETSDQDTETNPAS